MPTYSPHITELLLAWGDGDADALEKLTPLVYEELRRLARRYMKGERDGHVLQTTALVNEAYLRLVDSSRVRWQNRVHFFAVSARLMRRVLVDFARRERYRKRGGGATRVSLGEELAAAPERSTDLIELDEALEALAAEDPRAAEVVQLRFFGGLEMEEIAEVLKVSSKTAKRDWSFAKMWLLRRMNTS